jgi:hypothetical protein
VTLGIRAHTTSSMPVVRSQSHRRGREDEANELCGRANEQMGRADFGTRGALPRFGSFSAHAGYPKWKRVSYLCLKMNRKNGVNVACSYQLWLDCEAHRGVVVVAPAHRNVVNSTRVGQQETHHKVVDACTFKMIILDISAPYGWTSAPVPHLLPNRSRGKPQACLSCDAHSKA